LCWKDEKCIWLGVTGGAYIVCYLLHSLKIGPKDKEVRQRNYCVAPRLEPYLGSCESRSFLFDVTRQTGSMCLRRG
jgi:hypothetical protein